MRRRASILLCLLLVGGVNVFAQAQEPRNIAIFSAPQGTTTAVVLTNAAEASVNGLYTPRGTWGGKPYYVLSGHSVDPINYCNAIGNCTEAPYTILWGGSSWYINAAAPLNGPGSTLHAYSSPEDTNYPWEPTWWYGEGSPDPLPVVTSRLLYGPPTVNPNESLGTYSAGTGLWTYDTGNFTYQWFRADADGSNVTEISGATSADYTPASDDLGKLVKAKVTNGSASSYSAPVEVTFASGPMVVTNAQKLSLSPSTPVGTRVGVSDGFVVGGAGYALANDLYVDSGDIGDGRPIYKQVHPVDPTHPIYVQWNGSDSWYFHESASLGEDIYILNEDVEFPWLGVTPWTAPNPLDAPLPAPTLTHPAVQQLAAPGQGALLVSGDYSRVGLKTDRTASADGKPSYGWDRSNPDSAFIAWGYITAGRWEIYDTDVSSGGVVFYSTSDTPTPLTATDWKNASDDSPASITIALTDPQGGVAVLGGTQDGIFQINGTNDGKTRFVLLSYGTDSWQAAWNISESLWEITNPAGDGRLYYSLSDVATPDLATNWKNASDDSPASISVASVSVGEIYAGLFVTNDGATNGSSYVSQPFHGRQYYMGLNGGGSNNMHWDTDYNVWTDDVGVWTTQNVAFPFQGTDNGGGHTGATLSRNDVANERNWQVVP